LACRQEDRARLGRHLSDQRAAVRRPAGRRDPDRGRPHLLPGAGARSPGRALRDDGRHSLLSRGQTMDLSISQRSRTAATLSDPGILGPALIDAFKKLDPRVMVRNPVMFTVEVVATLTTVLFVRDLVTGQGGLGFSFQINLWLWFTVLFANFAEAVAEGRGKAQAATLRKARTDTVAKRLADPSAAKWTEVA